MKTTLYIKDNQESNEAKYTEADLYQSATISKNQLTVTVVLKQDKAKFDQELEERINAFKNGNYDPKIFGNFLKNLPNCNIYQVVISDSEYETILKNNFEASNVETADMIISFYNGLEISDWLLDERLKTTLFRHSDVDKLQEEFPDMMITEI